MERTQVGIARATAGAALDERFAKAEQQRRIDKLQEQTGSMMP